MIINLGKRRAMPSVSLQAHFVCRATIASCISGILSPHPWNKSVGPKFKADFRVVIGDLLSILFDWSMMRAEALGANNIPS
jgi:hypothetical protein